MISRRRCEIFKFFLFAFFNLELVSAEHNQVEVVADSVFFIEDSMHKPHALFFDFQKLSVVSEQIKERCADQAVPLRKILDTHMRSQSTNPCCFVLREVLRSWVIVSRLCINKSILKCKLDKLIVYFEALLDSRAVMLNIRLMVNFDSWRCVRIRHEVKSD